MSDSTQFTLLYASGAVVAIVAGSVARTGCQRFAGTMDEITAQITALKLNPLPDPATVTAATAAKAAAQKTFATAVAAGYTVPGVTPPLVLDLGESARAQFTGLVVLLDKLMAGGMLLATSTQAIADKSGDLHALPVSQIEGILLGYGAYFAGLYNTLHADGAAPSA